jgi:hypothetical protein
MMELGQRNYVAEEHALDRRGVGLQLTYFSLFHIFSLITPSSH